MSEKSNKQLDAISVSDITQKKITIRVAISEGFISISKEAVNEIEKNTNKKGNVIAAAKLAGIMAAKKTSSIIPLTHPLSIENIEIDFTLSPGQLRCRTTVVSEGKTGVEIESLFATEVALLTVYDMCKYIDKSMTISGIKLLKKTGGKSGDFIR